MGTIGDRKQYHHLYKSTQWKTMRARQLRKHPYCQCPHHAGKRLPADTVDHRTPHKGDRRIFFDISNLQSLTHSCHSRYKQSQERGGKGFDVGCDINGNPLNQDAAWYA